MGGTKQNITWEIQNGILDWPLEIKQNVTWEIQNGILHLRIYLPTKLTDIYRSRALLQVDDDR